MGERGEDVTRRNRRQRAHRLEEGQTEIRKREREKPRRERVAGELENVERSFEEKRGGLKKEANTGDKSVAKSPHQTWLSEGLLGGLQSAHALTKFQVLDFSPGPVGESDVKVTHRSYLVGYKMPLAPLSTPLII